MTRYWLAIAVIVVAGCSQDTAPGTIEPTSLPPTVEASRETVTELPPAVQMLSPAYQEAYRLLPQGPWARRYLADRFDDINVEGWARLDVKVPGEIVRQYELEVCDLLLSILVGAEYPSYVTSGGRCDVVEAVRLARSALQATGGRAAVSEGEFRDMLEERMPEDTSPAAEY